MFLTPAAFAINSGRAPARAAAVAALARGDWPVEVRTAAGSTPSSVSAWRRWRTYLLQPLDLRVSTAPREGMWSGTKDGGCFFL